MGKPCTKCYRVKDLTDFHKTSHTKDGRQSWCIVCVNAKNTKWRKDNPDKLRAKESKYYQDHKVSISTRTRLWRKTHWKQQAAYCAKSKSARLLRVPDWADLKAIRAFYSNCPDEMVVDHMIPLQGKKVSGLHVLSNLQYLTRDQNATKFNRYQNWG